MSNSALIRRAGLWDWLAAEHRRGLLTLWLEGYALLDLLATGATDRLTDAVQHALTNQPPDSA